MNDVSPTLTFCGAAGTVTGSKHLVEFRDHKILLDAGLFQGLKALRLRNWADPPFDPAQIDTVVLSHAHLDHSGYLPLLVRKGFRGRICCTPGTADLLGVLLRDSAHLQEEEAARANRYGYSKHKPALPLYTIDDAEGAIRHAQPFPYGVPFDVTEGMKAVFRGTGHILGSASIELQLGAGSPRRLVFSGDLGRWNRPILRDPEFVPEADVLLVESTYGDRIHATDSEEQLARIIRESARKGGALIVPAFAIDRAQELIWLLRKLEDEDKIPSLPVYVDSPMAIAASDIYCRHPEDHDIQMEAFMGENSSSLRTRQFTLVRTADESKALNNVSGPIIIISASGMATGGRVLHHLERRLPDSRTTVLLVGFQAAGTRGQSLQDGASTLRMHGQDVPVKASVVVLHGLSAHADRDEILKWLGGFTRAPERTHLVHGEPQAALALMDSIRAKFGWNVKVAIDGERVPV